MTTVSTATHPTVKPARQPQALNARTARALGYKLIGVFGGVRVWSRDPAASLKKLAAFADKQLS